MHSWCLITMLRLTPPRARATHRRRSRGSLSWECARPIPSRFWTVSTSCLFPNSLLRVQSLALMYGRDFRTLANGCRCVGSVVQNAPIRQSEKPRPVHAGLVTDMQASLDTKSLKILLPRALGSDAKKLAAAATDFFFFEEIRCSIRKHKKVFCRPQLQLYHFLAVFHHAFLLWPLISLRLQQKSIGVSIGSSGDELGLREGLVTYLLLTDSRKLLRQT